VALSDHGKSLPEVHGSVPVPAAGSWLRRLAAFSGPAYLVSVGYMDPGNWATDLQGGAQFGYQLIWVLVMSNLMAVLLQTLSARLGIVTGKDLAQACRDSYPQVVVWPLWILCEIAIVACDLAEVLGAAIGLKLLFGIPLLSGVLITGADVLLLLALNRLGMRRMEAFIIVLVATVGACFAVEILISKPDLPSILRCVIPRDEGGSVSIFGRAADGGRTVFGLHGTSLYVAVGILGATVMPHNLYLHSALVQTRAVGRTVEGKRVACRMNLIDSVIALNAALFVNAAILILAAATFHAGHPDVASLEDAHRLLTPLLGTTVASVLFALALLCAGQSSTITGTLAGQIVMEGFLHWRIRPWLRRLVSRSLAIVPAVLVISSKGERAVDMLLVLSQVVLSLQLSFAVIPLVAFTSDRRQMGEFVNKKWVTGLAVLVAATIVGLNLKLATETIGGWLAASGCASSSSRSASRSSGSFSSSPRRPSSAAGSPRSAGRRRTRPRRRSRWCRRFRRCPRKRPGSAGRSRSRSSWGRRTRRCCGKCWRWRRRARSSCCCMSRSPPAAATTARSRWTRRSGRTRPRSRSWRSTAASGGRR
jgi:manganese transport protein